MIKYKKIFFAIFLFTVFSLKPCFVLAKTPSQSTGFSEFNFAATDAKIMLVKDVASGKVLFSRNSQKQWSAASLTKLMTMLVFLDTKTSFNKRTKLLASDNPGGAALSSGTASLSVRDLWYVSLMQSTNNTTNALVRLTGLSKKNFVARMNKKAKALGMNNTTFVDPTGIDANNISTAEDLSILATAAFNNSTIRSAAQRGSYTLSVKISGKWKTVKNTDKLLYDDDCYVYGGKTGLLDESGYNFAGLLRGAKNSKLSIIVLGSESWNNLFYDAKLALNWSQKNWLW